MLLIQSVVVGQMMIIWCWINGWMVGGERGVGECIGKGSGFSEFNYLTAILVS